MDPLPDQHGRTFLVTGATAGIGRVIAETLGRAGARVHVAGRSKDKCEPVAAAIRAGGGSAEILTLDLADLASVHAAADRFLATGEPLHVLINNAGLAGQQGLTKDGFELAFGTNHLGHYLLTRLLLDRIIASAPARIVNVSSKSHYAAKGIDFTTVRRPTSTVTGLAEYSVSKLANVLFTRELSRRLAGRGVTTYAVHPGAIASEIWRRVPWPVRPIMKSFMKTTDDGAAAVLRCATSPELAGETGRYYSELLERTASPVALDDALGLSLWNQSEQWTTAHLGANPV